MANNMITFEGNLASDLNIRYTSTGKQVASVNLIHNHTRKNAEGKYKPTGKTTSMREVLWQEVLEGYQFSKGDLVGVTGYLKERQWKDAQGQNQRLNELVVTSIIKQAPAKGNGQTPGPGTTARKATGRGSRGRQAKAEAAQGDHTSRGCGLAE
jgi:single-stranded DNA-binding protein